MNIFATGANWEKTREKDLEKSLRAAWNTSKVLGACLVIALLVLASLVPLRRTIPYVVKQDSATGNLEVLQSFDNRVVGTNELMNKFWVRRYVLAREQYNWWLIGTDYDIVASMSDPVVFKDYAAQFRGDTGLDKVFGNFTDRRINIMSIAPSPTNPQQMVVRFERTTVSRGAVVEAPTVFVVNLTFRYNPNTFAAEAELIRNPPGFNVYSYRRDVEIPAANTKPDGKTQPSGLPDQSTKGG